ncbi:MAG: hypothetical protein ACO3A4_00175 [Silvanigrellaceae bacterium]
MLRCMGPISRLLCAAGVCSLSATALASDGALRIPALSAFAEVGYFTYKSKLAASNDTGLRYSYGFQIFGGDDRNLGAGMRANTMAASFALNSNKVTEKNQSFIFNYRKGFVYAGAAFGTTQVAFTENGTDAMDAFGNTMGGNLGAMIPFGRGNLVQSDVLILKPSSVKDSQQRNVSLGLRIESDTTLSFALSRKFIDLVLGFKYIKHTATVGSAGGTETQTIPSAGLRFGANL